ncbi:MAG: TonB-dependent receptor [Hyphomonadaceae bacterium]
MASVRRTSTEFRKRLLIGASVLAAVIGATPAAAQDAEEFVEEEEPIVITGTRLVRQDFDAISPVTTLSAQQIELTATLTADTLLNELPQVVPGNTRTSNNAGGEDFATVDLRGLGTNRTLVLVNGERVPVASTFGSVDINTIPPSLISRVEVVTGGATAVYGSDAIAGVVNFVLKDDYEGAELNLTYGSELETGNSSEVELNGLVGGDFASGRGNLTAYASYYSRDGVFQSEYDYSRVAGAACSNAGVPIVCDNVSEAIANGWTLLAPAGSATPPWGVINNDGANPFRNLSVLLPATFGAGTTDTNCDGVPGGAVNGGFLSFNDAGQLMPRNFAGFCGIPERSAGSTRYNFAPDNYLILPAERIAFTTNGYYRITDDLRLNLFFTYSNSQTDIQLAPTPAGGFVVNLTPGTQALIQANAPDLWIALQSRPNKLAPFTINRRFTEVGDRDGSFENNTFYFLAELAGDLSANWDWTLSGSYGHVLFSERLRNGVKRSAVNQGLASCQDFTGAPLGPPALPNCVPIDLYGPGTLTPAMINFVRLDNFGRTTVEEGRLTGFIRGDLFELPAGPVATVVGFEYRDLYASERHDNDQRLGDTIGFNAIQDQEGQIDVYELYAELALPLLRDAPLAHDLSLELGYRRSNYSSAGEIDTYKFGGEWAPTEWLRFRAMSNVATRAPNVFELFQAGDEDFTEYDDPCNDGQGNNAACIAAPGDAAINPAVYPGFVQEFEFADALAFGNPDLRPESADTLTYGVVVAPDWPLLRDFRMSIDYYRIEITDVIARLGGNFFLNDCYVNLNTVSCSRIHRDPVSGEVSLIDISRSNQDSLSSEGYDIQVEWSAPLGPGQLTINELYSILESFTFNGFEFAGTSSTIVGTALSDYKSVLSVSYDIGDWTVFGRWTYVPEMDYIFGGGVTPAASYIDASLRWDVTDNFTITANVDNVLNEAPPQIRFALQSNTDPQVYRVLGRTLTLSGRYRF